MEFSVNFCLSARNVRWFLSDTRMRIGRGIFSQELQPKSFHISCSRLPPGQCEGVDHYRKEELGSIWQQYETEKKKEKINAIDTVYELDFQTQSTPHSSRPFTISATNDRPTDIGAPEILLFCPVRREFWGRWCSQTLTVVDEKVSQNQHKHQR